MPALRAGHGQDVERPRALVHEPVDALVSRDVPEDPKRLPRVAPYALPREQDLGVLSARSQGLLRSLRTAGLGSWGCAGTPGPDQPLEPPGARVVATGVGGRTAETARDPRARVRECGQGKEPPGSDLDVLIVSEGVPRTWRSVRT